MEEDSIVPCLEGFEFDFKGLLQASLNGDLERIKCFPMDIQRNYRKQIVFTALYFGFDNVPEYFFNTFNFIYPLNSRFYFQIVRLLITNLNLDLLIFISDKYNAFVNCPSMQDFICEAIETNEMGDELKGVLWFFFWNCEFEIADAYFLVAKNRPDVLKFLTECREF